MKRFIQDKYDDVSFRYNMLFKNDPEHKGGESIVLNSDGNHMIFTHVKLKLKKKARKK